MSPLELDEMQARIETILKADPSMILAFKSKFVTDEMWEYAVAMEPSLFTECKRKTYRISAIAISKDGFHIGNIDPINYTGDQFKRLCNLAVEQNPKAIVSVPKEFRTAEMMSYAYAKDPELLVQEKKLSPSMVLSILEHNPGLIRYVVNPTDDMIIAALEKDPRVIVYFTSISDRVREYYEEHYPQYACMVIHD